MNNDIQQGMLLSRMARRRKVLAEKAEEAINRKITKWSNLYLKTKDKRYLTKLSQYIDVDWTPNDVGVPERNDL